MLFTGKRYIDHWTEAGFDCGIPIKNTGAGAAMMRIEAARRVFPRCWFNDSTTEAGRDALGYYHERQDEKRSIGLGPEQAMRQMHSGIWQSRTRSRRLIPGGSGDRHPHASALTGRTELSFDQMLRREVRKTRKTNEVTLVTYWPRAPIP